MHTYVTVQNLSSVKMRASESGNADIKKGSKRKTGNADVGNAVMLRSMLFRSSETSSMLEFDVNVTTARN